MVTIHPRWTYDAFAPFDTCPACLGPVEPYRDGEQVSFRCDACSIAWRLTLGHLLWSRLDRPDPDPGHVPAQRSAAGTLTTGRGEATAGQGR